MKSGYKVLIHKDVDEDRLMESREFCDWFIEKANTRGYGDSGHGSKSFYRRGILGRLLGAPSKKALTDQILTFKRLSRNRRVFGIIPVYLLMDLDEKEIDVTSGCMCAHHVGGIRCNIKGGLNEDDFTEYYITGEIKG